jgi:hypothetical protein
MGKLSQFGHRKSLDIESIIAAGYHQAMFHVLECMKLSLTIGRLGEPPVCACSRSDIGVVDLVSCRHPMQARRSSQEKSLEMLLVSMTRIRPQSTQAHPTNHIIHFLACPRMTKVKMLALVRLAHYRHRRRMIITARVRTPSHPYELHPDFLRRHSPLSQIFIPPLFR